MKVSAIISSKFIKSIAIAAPLVLTSPALANFGTPQNLDSFEKTSTEQPIFIHQTNEVAPIKIINGEKIKPSIIVDKSENKLYLYNTNGALEATYSVGLGKTSTPTDTGLRIITDIENYPYSKADPNTKRHKFPNDYGPKVIIIAIVDPKTGEITGYNGEFIHGTNKPESIGKNESKGCVRMNNEDVKELAKKIKKGQYVLIRE